jgi:nickel/cobalt transporter (NicO) family protein
MSTMLIAAWGMFALGLAHAFGPDHLAAIATLSGNTPSRTRVLLTSFRFALGHSALLVVVGAAALLLNLLPSEGAIRIAESIGGIALIALGAAMLHALAQKDQETLERHGHKSFFVGGLLAASGTRSFLLAVPATASAHEIWGALLVATSFGAGVTLGMCAFGFLWGWGKQSVLSSPRTHRWANAATAMLTIALGLYWSVAEWI